MEANELKDYIISNNYIEPILTAVGCHGIHEYPTEYRAALPNGTNKTAVCVKKDTLLLSIRNSEGNVKGDIFTLVMQLENCGFGKANRRIHEILNLKYEYVKKKEESHYDPLALFKKIRKRRNYDFDVPVFDDNALKEYIPLPHISWIREGIMPFTCERFNIGYSFDRKRIVIPERKWDGDDNEYIGISGRTTIENYELFDIPKYTKLSDEYPKGMNVYGLNENYKSIIEAGYVVVFESQKSVLKRHSRKDETCVAIGNCELTPAQVKILISLNVEIIICLDEGITEEHIWKECEHFYGIRQVSYIYDKWGIILKGSKNSPADEANKLYNFMLKYRFNYDAQIHKKYLDYKKVKYKYA